MEIQGVHANFPVRGDVSKTLQGDDNQLPRDIEVQNLYNLVV